MGVLACSRNGCDNIMCDRYSGKHGYICWQCYDELVELGPDAKIKAFMRSPKEENRQEEAKARFNAVFPSKD